MAIIHALAVMAVAIALHGTSPTTPPSTLYPVITMERMELYDFLRRLGLRANRPGFFYTAQAVLMISDQPELSRSLAQDLYPKIAEIYGVSCESVEHDITATLHSIWRHSPEMLVQLLGQPIPRCPPVPEFLQILLSAFVQNQRETSSA